MPTINGTENDDILEDTGVADDTINALDGNDTITSRDGRDSVYGGGGSDTLVLAWAVFNAQAATNSLSVNETGGFDGSVYRGDLGYMGFSSIERFVISTGGGDDSITTATGDDIVSTGAGNDAVNVGSGVDQADGGNNTDASRGSDGISANLSAVTVATLWNLTANTYSGLAGTNFTNFEYFGSVITGSGNDVIVTTSENRDETITSGAGNDTITSFNGRDQINGGADTDTLVLDWSLFAAQATTSSLSVNETGGFDGAFFRADLGYLGFGAIERFVISSGGGNDNIVTGTGDDIVSTGAGNDEVNVGSGVDQADGGNNADTSRGSDGISANLSAATVATLWNLTANTYSGMAGTHFTNFEHFGTVTTGSGDDVIVTTTENRAETINTGAGNDTITSFDGGDQINGGADTDTLVLDWSGSNGQASNSGNPAVNGTGGFDGSFFRSDLGYMGFSSIERFVISTGGGGDSITTGTGDDIVSTGAGNDEVNIGSGVDQADGGTNADTSRGSDGISANLSAATVATLWNLTANSYSGMTGTSFTNFEHFGTVTTGSGDDVIVTTTENRAETINTGAGNDTITSFNGGDQINGGADTDTLVLDWSSFNSGASNNGSMSVNGAGGFDGSFLRNDLGYMGFSSIERFVISTGSAGDNITTAAGDDVAITGAGADTVNAAAGDDLVDGGAGDDNLNGGVGNDTVSYLSAAGSVSMNLGTAGPQNTFGSGTDTLAGFENVIGSAFTDVLTGTDQDNEIDGGADADAMTGGRGSDTYTVDDTGDSVVELAGQGIDTVETDLASFTLGAEVENLVATGSDQVLTGNALNNLLAGDLGGDTLNGGAGDDLLVGLTGADVLNGGDGRDILIGGVIDQTNLVVNGSFETQDGTNEARQYVLSGPGGIENGEYNGVPYRLAETLSGWQRSGTAGFELNTFGAASYGNGGFDRGDGDVALDLEARAGENTTIYQDIVGVPRGTPLLLSFAAAQSTGGSLGANPSAVLEVVWNGTVIATIASTASEMTQYAFTVTASGEGTDRLEFREIGSGSDARGTSLDAVRLNVILGGLDGAQNTLDGGIGNDVLIGDAGDDLMAGGADNDALDGGAGNDQIDGGSGTDTMAGGDGDDEYVVDSLADTVTEAADEGTDEVRTTTSYYFLDDNVENLTGIRENGLGQVLTGNGLANVITGTDHADRLDGAAGLDTLVGGAGNDVYVVDSADGDTITEATDGGTDTVETSLASFSLAGTANVENLTGTLATGQSLTGNSGDNTITGNIGDDTLDGNGGLDTLVGGDGDDAYIVDSTDDVVTENAGEGDADEVRTSLSSYTLAENVERLVYTGTGVGSLRGNAANNSLAGSSAGDVLDLRDGGDDSGSGGGGIDQFYYGAAFTAADANDGGADTDVVVLQGNYAVTMGAASLVNVEYLSLQSGSSTRYGEAGTNSYDYDITFLDVNVAAGQRFTVNASQLLAGESFVFDGSAETDGQFLVYAGYGDDDLTGGSGDDMFHFEGTRWGAGDVVDGGVGADALIIRGSGAGMRAIAFGETQLNSIESITVSDRFALESAGRPSYDLTLANGNVAPGATLILNGSTLLASDQVFNVDGSAVTSGHLRLYGGAGADTMIGGAGNDLIYAAGGADVLTGGGGADSFQLRSLTDSAADSPDEILDFASGLDKFELSFLDADANVAGDQAFTFIGEDDFSSAAGQLRAFDTGLGHWRVEGDVNGDGLADFALHATLATADPLGSTDFIL